MIASDNIYSGSEHVTAIWSAGIHIEMAAQLRRPVTGARSLLRPGTVVSGKWHVSKVCRRLAPSIRILRN